MEAFYHVEVERVLMSRSQKAVKIYIIAEELIPRNKLREMEFQLKRQIFGKIGIVPRILERYCFSEEYKFTELFEKYRESFLEDLKEQNIFNYYIFKNSNYEIQEDTILLHTEENLFTRARQEEICHFVRTIFAEKFGFDITLSFSYFLPERKPEEIEFVTIENKSAKISELPEISEKMNTIKDLKIKKAEETVKKPAKQDRNSYNQTAKAKNEGNYTYRKKLPDDPSIFFGRPFEGEVVPMIEIQEELGDVVIQGKVQEVKERELRNGKILMVFFISDFTDTIAGKLFLQKEQRDEIVNYLKRGAFLKLAGNAQLDQFEHEISITSIRGIKTIPDFTTKRIDQSEKKRVELHAHTMMSDMDAVVPVKELIGRAKEWGHSAIAITDHGVVQSFPDANHAVSKDEIGRAHV